MSSISELIGKTLAGIDVARDSIVFTVAGGERYRMWHSQDCCESVAIEDISGYLQDLIGYPIVVAEESVSDKRPADLPEPEYEDESQTWTLYRLATERGYVVIRWYGSSNGYYSEAVDFERIDGDGT